MLLGHIFRSEYPQVPLVLVTSLNMLFYVNLCWFCVTARYFHLSEPNLARSSRSPHADFHARVFTVNTQEASCQNSASVMLACREGLTCAAFFAGISSPFGAISRSFHSLMAANKWMLAWVFQVFVHFWTCEDHSLLNLHRPFPFLKLFLCQPHKPSEQQKHAKGRSFLSNYTGWLLVSTDSWIVDFPCIERWILYDFIRCRPKEGKWMEDRMRDLAHFDVVPLVKQHNSAYRPRRLMSVNKRSCSYDNYNLRNPTSYTADSESI